MLGGVSSTFQAPGQASPAGSYDQPHLREGGFALAPLTEGNPMARARQEGTSEHVLRILTMALLMSRPLAAPPNPNIHFHQNFLGRLGGGHFQRQLPSGPFLFNMQG